MRETADHLEIILSPHNYSLVFNLEEISCAILIQIWLIICDMKLSLPGKLFNSITIELLWEIQPVEGGDVFRTEGDDGVDDEQ
jgi:hypothetical protein